MRSAPTHNTWTTWTLADILDLEFFLHLRRNGVLEGVGQEETAALATALGTLEEDELPPRRGLLRAWLHVMRENYRRGHPDRVLPGEAAREAYLLLLAGLAALGLGCGMLTASVLLRYNGQQPVNVSLYLIVVVGGQLLLLALLGLWGLWRRLGRGGLSLAHRLPSRLLLRRIETLLTRGRENLDASTRLAMDAALGLLRGRNLAYGPIVTPPLFMLFQAFGLCFNLGVLGITLYRVLFTDLAFGWQSTLRLGADKAHQVASLLALPWSWFCSTCLPSLEQIRGSRIILKEGLDTLATPDLAAWWPFLICAVICYGLAPRLALLCGAWWRQQRLLERISLDHAECETLIQALLRQLRQGRDKGGTAARGTAPEKPAPASSRRRDTPTRQPHSPPAPEEDQQGSPAPTGRRQVQDGPGHPGQDLREDEDSPTAGTRQSPDGPATARAQDPGPSAAETCLVALTDEIAPEVDRQRLLELLRDLDSRPPGPVVEVDLAAGWHDLASRAGEHASLVLVMEGWQPPIDEILEMLSSLRQDLGARHPLCLALTGRPRPDDPLTPLGETELRVWRQRTASLGDPFLRVEPLVPGEAA